MAKAFRAYCLVPNCRHTKGVDYDPEECAWEWICAKHWGLVSRSLKLNRSRFSRRIKRLMHGAIERRYSVSPPHSWAADPVCEPNGPRWVRYGDQADFRDHMQLAAALRHIWGAMRKQAIEGAMGI